MKETNEKATQFTVSNLDGLFGSLEEARNAWAEAGSPTQVSSSTWITSYDNLGRALETITLAPAVR